MFSKLMVFLIILTMSISACGSDSKKPETTSVEHTASAPVSLDGTWTSDDPQMVAHISNDKILINLTLDEETTGLYWKGSLDTSIIENETVDAMLYSKGDTQAMEASLMGSQDSAKKFLYKDGKLSFKFTILGTTQTVHLER